jgi:tetratricopeptide (TPR) repeat protein
VVLTKLTRYREAAFALEHAIRINPRNSVVFNNIGGAYSSDGQYKKAVKAFKQAISLKPDFAEARFNLAIVYLKTGDRNIALRQYYELKMLDKQLTDKLYRDCSAI